MSIHIEIARRNVDRYRPEGEQVTAICNEWAVWVCLGERREKIYSAPYVVPAGVKDEDLPETIVMSFMGESSRAQMGRAITAAVVAKRTLEKSLVLFDRTPSPVVIKIEGRDLQLKGV